MPVHARHQDLVDLTLDSLRSVRADEPIEYLVYINRLEVAAYPTPGSFDWPVIDAAIKYATTAGRDTVKIVHGPERCVAGTWNFGIDWLRTISQADVIAILNNDITLDPDCLPLLAEVLRSYEDVSIVGALNTRDETPQNLVLRPGVDFACFMVNNTLPEEHGWFDENFMPAYFEDNDMYARVVMRNKRAVTNPAAQFYHHGSRTINVDNVAGAGNSRTFPLNASYFHRKWGRDPAHDDDEIRRTYFHHPFNNPSLSLDDWPHPVERPNDFW